MYGLLQDSPVDLDKLRASIIRHEGERAEVYDDANGKPIVKGYTVVGNPTIGIGRLATKAHGLSAAERRYLLDNDISACLAEAQQQPWYGLASPCEPRLRAICEVLFQLGLPAFNDFHHAVAALNRGDWPAAAASFLDSLWAQQQSPERAETLAAMILTGCGQSPQNET